MKYHIKRLFTIAVYLFAIIGFILVMGYLAIRFGFTNNRGFIDDRFLGQPDTETLATVSTTTPEWNKTAEWQTLKDALVKDKQLIEQVSDQVNIKPRLLVSLVVVEQLRLFNDDRESFKQFFEPLKILGSQSVFSWGVMGIKKETAIAVENNLKDPNSPRYLGPEYENMLDFGSDDFESERFNRITDQHNHYYSYLYGALFIKEIEAEWKNAGYDISDRPEILATLYNLGFSKSNPKADPKVGGAAIPIGSRTYSFGGLAYDFYYSGELVNEFPK